MTSDREQTRRDAGAAMSLDDALQSLSTSSDSFSAGHWCEVANVLNYWREQAERERDEWREAVMAERHSREETEADFKRNLRLGTEEVRAERDAALARLGKVPALVEALRDAPISGSIGATSWNAWNRWHKQRSAALAAFEEPGVPS